MKSYILKKPAASEAFLIFLGIASTVSVIAFVLVSSTESLDIGAMIGWGVVATASVMAFWYFYGVSKRGVEKILEINDTEIVWSTSYEGDSTRIPIAKITRIVEEIDDGNRVFCLEVQSGETIRMPGWVSLTSSDRDQLASYLMRGITTIPVELWRPKS